MTLKTSVVTVRTVTDAEVARVDSEVDQLTSDLARVSTDLANALERIKELESQLPGEPEPPVPSEPPTPSMKRLWVDGSKLRSKTGHEVVIRGIEMMYGSNANNVGAAEFCSRMLQLGANAISPLFVDERQWNANAKNYGTEAVLTPLLDAARKAGLIVGINADHQYHQAPRGRDWLAQPWLVSLANGYDNVFLECEIETPNGQSAEQWSEGVKGLVKFLREAGHKSLIKVGGPFYGRRVKEPLAKCKEVLLADPERNVMFTFQAYWGEVTNGNWSYQTDNGFQRHLIGTKDALTACANSGCVFLPGLNWRDDVGTTGELALMDHCHQLGLGYQHWVLAGDGLWADSNILSHWNLGLDSITTTGRQLQTKLLAQRTMPFL